MNDTKIVFGPVPSRRVGQSLGINNVPFKTCSYSCVYCQIGSTETTSLHRQSFYPVERIVRETKNTLSKLSKHKENIDFISFVPDGEPTLDKNIGEEIVRLKHFGIKVAVFSNASLINREDVREELQHADLVSLKIDTVDEKAWRKINRPCKDLEFDEILKGIQQFRDTFQGSLLTETMLIKALNDSDSGIAETTSFIAGLKPATAFIGIPSRPPAEAWVSPVKEEVLNMAYAVFRRAGINAELAMGAGTSGFGFTGDVSSDILNIVSVHPMSEAQIKSLLKKAGSSWNVVEELIKNRQVKEIMYSGTKYYLKRFNSDAGNAPPPPSPKSS